MIKIDLFVHKLLMQIQTYHSSSCSICREDYQLTDSCLSLYCGHLFHESCMWSYEIGKSHPCPLCRKQFVFIPQDKLENLTSPYKSVIHTMIVTALIFSSLDTIQNIATSFEAKCIKNYIEPLIFTTFFTFVCTIIIQIDTLLERKYLENKYPKMYCQTKYPVKIFYCEITN